jgi:glycerol dehydrogenase-like iron-containing ADH family enzyme
MNNFHRVSGENIDKEEFFFPGKITKGEGEIRKINAGPFKAPFLFAGPYVMKKYGRQILKENSSFREIVFSGEVCPGEFYRVKKILKDGGADMLFALGGGKVMDLAKLVKREIPAMTLTNIPTSAATCAAMTPVSVMYDKDGVYTGTADSALPDEVIIDYEIFDELPMPFFAAGAADTLAKYYETIAAVKYGNITPTAMDNIAFSIASECKDRLKDIIYLKWHRADNLVRRELADINIVASGLSSCVGRYSMMGLIAHAAAHAATIVPAAREYLHGEHTAAGLIMQETMLKGKKHLVELNSFFEILEVPQGLSGIGIKKNDLKVFYEKYQLIDHDEKISLYSGKKLGAAMIEAYL